MLDIYEVSTLQAAAESAGEEIVHLLLQYGADVTGALSRHNRAMERRSRILPLLLEASASNISLEGDPKHSQHQATHGA